MTTLLTSPTTLFARAQAGDRDAIDDLLREHRDSIVAVCRRRLRSRVDADDAVQETMLRALGALGAVRDETRLRSYLCRIAERVCLDMMRAGARPMPVEADSAPQDEPESLAIRREEAELVRRTLQALSERQAQALWMRDAMGETVPTVAEHLGMTEGSTRVLLTRARRQMRDGWAKVAAMLPGFGLKLPAPLAKLVASTGVLPAIVAPAAVLVAAVLVLPTLGGDDTGQTGPELGVVTAPAAVLQPPQPTAPAPSAAAGSTQTESRPAAASTVATPAAPASAAAPAGEVRVATGAVDVEVDRDDPQDDDVTAGGEEILGVGTSIDETLTGLGVATPPQVDLGGDLR